MEDGNMKNSELFELRKKVGNLNSLFGITDYVLNDGPGKGVRIFDVRNGNGLELHIAADRGLDIPQLSFHGINMGFCSKVGMRHPSFYAEDGVRGFLKQFNAGMLTTCGITYAGSPGEDEGRKLGLHGPYDNTPAQGVAAYQACNGDEILLKVAGSVKETCVFEEHMRLDRVITVSTECNQIAIHDTVTNLGFADTPLMLVYHVNFGYPMLDEGAEVYTNAASIIPRDGIAAKGLHQSDAIEQPTIGREEECFMHSDFAGPQASAMLYNKKLGIAGIVSFDAEAFPILCQWKCMRAGDYALGLEPTMAGVENRSVARKEGRLTMLKPGETKAFDIRLRFIDDKEQIAGIIREMQ